MGTQSLCNIVPTQSRCEIATFVFNVAVIKVLIEQQQVE